MTRALMLVAAVCIGLTSAACSNDEDGIPVGGDNIDSTPSSTPGNGADDGVPQNAPKVSNPIPNLEKYLQKPCDAIPKEQARQLGLSTATPNPDHDNGPTCEFADEQGKRVTINFNNKQPLGIAGVYRNHEQYPQFYDYFEPTEVAGFPGVFAASIDGRANGRCNLAVGITENQVLTVTVSIRQATGESDSCKFAKKAAETAATTMSRG